jgi:hypothetical protein
MIDQCTCGRSREGCDFHDPKLQPAANRTTWDEQQALYDADPLGHLSPCAEDWLRGQPYPYGWCSFVPVLEIKFDGTERLIPAGWRLLGKDDPEVSNDLIYAVPGGGVVGVPE